MTGADDNDPRFAFQFGQWIEVRRQIATHKTGTDPMLNQFLASDDFDRLAKYQVLDQGIWPNQVPWVQVAGPLGGLWQWPAAFFEAVPVPLPIDEPVATVNYPLLAARQAALSAADTYVDHLPHQPITASERARIVLDVARYLLGENA